MHGGRKGDARVNACSSLQLWILELVLESPGQLHMDMVALEPLFRTLAQLPVAPSRCKCKAQVLLHQLKTFTIQISFNSVSELCTCQRLILGKNRGVQGVQRYDFVQPVVNTALYHFANLQVSMPVRETDICW